MTRTVLVVEDEPAILESLQFLLEREGLTVRSVTDGLAAQRFLAKELPDLILLDVMIPNIDGFEVLRHVRMKYDTEKLPIVILSAKGQESDRLKAQELGANEFITKPFSNRDLVARILAYLPDKPPVVA